jgi:hypothetical protein
VAATRDQRLNRTDCAVLGSIFDHINRKTGRCDPALTTIARTARASERSAPRSIAKLVAFGYLTRTSGGRDRSNRYGLGAMADHPDADQHVNDESVIDKAVTDKLVTDEAVPVTLTNTSKTALTSLSGELAFRENLPNEPTNTPVTAHAMVGRGGASRFADFWGAYKRKAGSKKRAEEIWRTKNLDLIADLIIDTVAARAASDSQWESKRFIPHPATYLGQERWKDDWEPNNPRGSTSAFRVTPSGLSSSQVDAENLRSLQRAQRQTSAGGAP